MDIFSGGFPGDFRGTCENISPLNIPMIHIVFSLLGGLGDFETGWYTPSKFQNTNLKNQFSFRDSISEISLSLKYFIKVLNNSSQVRCMSRCWAQNKKTL